MNSSSLKVYTAPRSLRIPKRSKACEEKSEAVYAILTEEHEKESRRERPSSNSFDAAKGYTPPGKLRVQRASINTPSSVGVEKSDAPPSKLKVKRTPVNVEGQMLLRQNSIEERDVYNNRGIHQHPHFPPELDKANLETLILPLSMMKEKYKFSAEME